MPAPIIQHDDTRPRRDRVTPVICILLTLVVCGLVLWFAHPADAKSDRRPEPIPAPPALMRERAACTTLQRCKNALERAYDANTWQRKTNLVLAREMLGDVANWECIHSGIKANGQRVGNGEASWTDAGDPYWGGLQMDRTFMLEYGRDMIRKHHGGLANTWTPREQIIVAQRAFAQGRGYNPWPNTGRACGLVS